MTMKEKEQKKNKKKGEKKKKKTITSNCTSHYGKHTMHRKILFPL